MPDVKDAGSDDFYGHVGTRVRHARIASGFSQALLASRVGLTRSSIANLEAGRQHISLYHFALIAQALNADLADLLPYSSRELESHIPPEALEKLADSPESAQDFVRGAVARLHGEPEPGQ